MRFKFWEREPEYYEEPPPKKKPETLSTLADKLIMKKMKADPDGYGLTAAERIKHISKEESKGIVEQLKEFRELKKVLTDLGGGGEGGSSLLKDIISVLPDILQALPQAMGAVKQQLPQIEPYEPPKLPKAEQEPVNISDLTKFLDEPPEAVLEQLRQQYPGWIPVLKVQNYAGIMKQLEPFRNSSPEVQEIIAKLESDAGKEWLKQVLKWVKSQ